MPNYALQDRAKWASYPDAGVLFDYLFQTACTTCFHPINAGDLCPDCQKFVEEERRKRAEAESQRFADMISPSSRFVHVYGVGRVDPWTREGKQYLDS